MGFQIPGPTNGKVQYLVGMYQAVVLDGAPRNFDDIGSVREVLQKPVRWRSWYAGDEAITGSFGEDAHHDQEAG